MKKAIQLLGVLLAILPALSFGQAKKTTWPEMKAFHTVMAGTFHPAEEGNFAPLRERAEELFNAAKTWQKSPIADGFKQEETTKALKELVVRCAAVKKGVEANQDNNTLLRLITEAHDGFHTIVGECRKSEE